MPKKKEKKIWIGRYVFIALSILWGLIALYGFFTFGWISRLPDLTPAEFVVQICSLIFPIGVFGLLAVFLDRNRLMTDEMAAARAYLEELVYPSDLGANYVQNLNEDLKQQIQLFKSSFADVTKQTNQVREDLTEWIEDLNKIIQHMDEQTQNMAGYVQQLAGVADEAQEQSSNAGRHLANQADILLQVSDKTETQLIEIGKQLHAQTEAIAQNAHAVAQSEKTMSNSLDKSTKLISALEENARRIEKAMKTTEDMEGFLSDTDKVLLRFKEIGTTLDMRLKTLKQQKNEPIVIEKIENKGISAKEFTTKMQQILDKLQGISVEMVSVFQLKNEEELWDHYYAGDKAVFMRQINSLLTGTRRQKAIDLIHKNTEFKTNIEEYMKAFENLTRGLEDSPWLGVLVGSDPGRLYMLLASLLKKEKTSGGKEQK